MVTVVKARRRSRVLTPSSLACLSVPPTINLTAGCLHDCVYCYIRGYRNYPGESRIILYEDTLERLRHELRPGQPKPRAVYFSPSSDLFQPAPEVLELSHAVLEFLFSQGTGVAFLTKGEIPDKTLELLIDHWDLVQAQIGLITLDEEIVRIFEPHAASPRTRLRQLHSLITGGVAAAARLDPILPTLTDDPEALDRHFAGPGAGRREARCGGCAAPPTGHFVLAEQKSTQRDAGDATGGLPRRGAGSHARRRISHSEPSRGASARDLRAIAEGGRGARHPARRVRLQERRHREGYVQHRWPMA